MKNKNILIILGVLALTAVYFIDAKLATGGSILMLGTVFAGRFSNASNVNNFGENKGIYSLSAPITFGSTIEYPVPTRKAFLHYIDVAQLTGAMTFNATNISSTYFDEGDEVYIMFQTDGTQRVVTWGTNFRPGVAATCTVVASGTAVCHCMWANGKLQVLSQSIAAN